MKKNFNILHLDPLSQGVSKEEEEIYFVYNTLPGESGNGEVIQNKKNIHFGYLSHEEDLLRKSPDRIRPLCPHFFSCNGCHFLHTNYKKELELKKQSMDRFLHQYEKKMSANLSSVTVKVWEAPNRLEYRNRIQLHYDLSKKEIGLIGYKKDNIIPVSDCLIGSTKIQQQIKELYENNHWLTLVSKGSPKRGHMEIMENYAGGIDLILNGPYSHGGFRQVNNQMNEVLTSLVQQKQQELFPKATKILDLFGGSGNLTKAIPIQSTVIDAHGENLLVDHDGHQHFLKLNLYSRRAPNVIRELIDQAELPLAILDPPRSGLKNIDEFFSDQNNLQGIIYVSCNPATLFRDLQKLANHKIVEVHLLDLFPGTFHYETLVVLARK